MVFPKCSGIYAIQNTITGKYYIGQSVNIASRLYMHINMLRHDEHYNNHLQRAWNKSGETAFSFHVLEMCDESEMDVREIYYISLYNSYKRGYNQTEGGGGMRGYTMSESSREKMKTNHYDCVGANNPRAKAVFLLNTGERFDCIADAAKKYGVARADISKNAKGKSKSAGARNGERFVWAYEKDYVVLSDEQKERLLYIANNCKRGEMCHRSKKVICIDTGEVFNTIGDAAKHYNVCNSVIGCACSGKQMHAARDKVSGEPLRWMYYNEYLYDHANRSFLDRTDMVS